MTKRRHHFTLIEILVVAAITGVLITLALPAFNKLVTGDKVTRAAQMISTALGQARSEAIVGRRYVAVVFVPTTQDTGVTAGTAGRKFAVVSLTRTGGSDYAVDAKRAADARWRTLPAGTALVAVLNSAPTINGSWFASSANRNLSGNLTSISGFTNTLFTSIITSTDSAGISLRGIIFTPEGTVTDGEKYFVVTEGLVEGTSHNFTPTFPNTTNPDTTAPNNCYSVKLNPFSGTTSYYEL